MVWWLSTAFFSVGMVTLPEVGIRASQNYRVHDNAQHVTTSKNNCAVCTNSNDKLKWDNPRFSESCWISLEWGLDFQNWISSINGSFGHCELVYLELSDVVWSCSFRNYLFMSTWVREPLHFGLLIVKMICLLNTIFVVGLFKTTDVIDISLKS